MEARSASGSNCTGVEVGSIQGPAAVSNSRVAQPEGVTGEPAPRGGVPDAVVVAGMAGGVGEQQLAAGQLHLQAIVCDLGALDVDGQHLAVGAQHFFRPVDRGGAGPQRARVHHVALAAGVHQQRGVGAGLHQLAGAAGVVQVHVGGDHVLHIFGGHTEGLQRGQDAWYARCSAGVDDGGAALVNHHEGGVEAWPGEAGVHGVDAQAAGFDERGQGRSRK
jgi:hypothetical protein